MSRRRQCSFQAWAVATSGDGAGAENVVKFPFVVVAESYDGEVGNTRWVDGDVG